MLHNESAPRVLVPRMQNDRLDPLRLNRIDRLLLVASLIAFVMAVVRFLS